MLKILKKIKISKVIENTISCEETRLNVLWTFFFDVLKNLCTDAPVHFLVTLRAHKYETFYDKIHLQVNFSLEYSKTGSLVCGNAAWRSLDGISSMSPLFHHVYLQLLEWYPLGKEIADQLLGAFLRSMEN